MGALLGSRLLLLIWRESAISEKPTGIVRSTFRQLNLKFALFGANAKATEGSGAFHQAPRHFLSVERRRQVMFNNICFQLRLVFERARLPTLMQLLCASSV